MISGAIAGAGSGGSFVTTTLYLILLSDIRKTSRNFSFFAACCGTSYFLYAGVLGITSPCRAGPCRSSTLVVSTTGLLVMVLFVLRNRSCKSENMEKSVPFSKESLDFVYGTLRYRQHLNSWSKVEVLLAVLFYTYTCELISRLLTHCVLITGSYRYHAEAIIPYGIGFMLASLQWSYYYKHWISPIRTLTSAVLLVTGLIISLIVTFRHSACATPQLLESWYIVPLVSLFVGQSLGSVTCETYTVINLAWLNRGRFSVLILIETFWGLCFTLFEQKFTVTVNIGILSVLGLFYCGSTLNLQRRAKRFYERIDSYLVEESNSSKKCGSKYGATRT